MCGSDDLATMVTDGHRICIPCYGKFMKTINFVGTDEHCAECDAELVDDHRYFMRGNNRDLLCTSCYQEWLNSSADDGDEDENESNESSEDATILLEEIKSDVVSVIEDIDPSDVTYAERDLDTDIQQKYDNDGYPSKHQINKNVILSGIRTDKYDVKIDIKQRE